jgi:hypothetical protein
MTQQEIRTVRVLLGFALFLAAFFPLCTLIVGLTTTFWIWGILYGGCFVGVCLLLWPRESQNEYLRQEQKSALEAQIALLTEGISTTCAHVPREDITHIVRLVVLNFYSELESDMASDSAGDVPAPKGSFFRLGKRLLKVGQE